MASRSHVDVNERRLRPIYDCLDNGNNKKAIQEADKVLKKQKDLTCARVLKALALLRMGRHAEGSSILMAIHAMEPTEEQTLNAMSICYKEMQQYHNIALLYEAAAKHQPNNEDILSCLFMAHVRLGNYQQQQRTAMLLHKLRPNKNPYYFWAVMSIVMQAHSDSKLGKAMYLPLAEKMTHRYIKEEKIEADAEILLYLIILELQEKWEEALVVLEGPLGARLGGNELNLRETRLALMYTKLSKWDKVSVIYKEMLNHTPDDWAFWLKYLESGFHLVDEGYVAPEEEDSKDREEGEKSNKVKPDGTVQAMLDFVDEKIQSSKKDLLLRGPFLARLELLRQLLGRQDSATQMLGKPLELLKEYFELFGHKACCHGDMKLFVHLLSEEELEELLEFMKAGVDLTSTNEDIKYAKDIQQMTRHMVLLQLSRTVGYHSKMEIQEALRLSKELLLRAREGLKFGDKLLTTDLQFSDDYLLLAVHILLDVWRKTGDDIHIWQAIVHLELGIRDSPSNFQFKLLLIRLYCVKGIFDPCPALYDNMEIKHIMNDTMGYIVANHVVRLGHLVGAGTMYTTVVRFFSLNQKEASEHLMSSYKFGTFARIQEFVEFQDRLDNSLQYHSANTEKLLLDLIMQTDRHDLTERAVECMNIHPKTSDKLDLSKLRDNRDLKISVCWDPPSEIQHEENQSKSLEEEKMWLRLRWLQLQVLLAAVWAGQEMAGISVVNGNRSNKEGEESSESPLEVMNVRLKELQEHSNQCQHLSEPNQYHLLQGPFRTRISTHLCPPHLEVLTAMVDCINYLHSVQEQGLDKVNGQEEVCWKNVQEIAKKLVLKDVDGLLKDVGGKRQLDSSALEQLVASVESISYVTLLVGVCNRVLKPLKATWSKRNKKGKGPAVPQPTTFENFNHLIKELSSTTKELHRITSGLDPVFSSLDIASLRLADIPEEEKPQREAERLVWSKVERSVQQSSREICEVLYHKQIYLNSLSL